MFDCRAVVRPASGHVLLESLSQRKPYYDRMKAVSLARLSAFGPYPLRADESTSEARSSTAIQRGDGFIEKWSTVQIIAPEMAPLAINLDEGCDAVL